MTTKPTVQVLGAARCLTGSEHLPRTNGGTTLIDCGPFQALNSE